MKRKNCNALTDHHILPKSRGGQKTKGNIKRIPEKKHQAYHTLFSNLTPDEVIQYLNEVLFQVRGGFISAEDWLQNQ